MKHPGKRGHHGWKRRETNSRDPGELLHVGTFVHSSEGQMVCKAVTNTVPGINAAAYLENKSLLGKIDEVLGPINEFYFTVKTGDGIVASSFSPGQQVFVGTDRLIPLERFLGTPRPLSKSRPPSRGRSFAQRGGRGGFRGRRGQRR